MEQILFLIFSNKWQQIFNDSSTCIRKINIIFKKKIGINKTNQIKWNKTRSLEITIRIVVRGC